MVRVLDYPWLAICYPNDVDDSYLDPFGIDYDLIHGLVSVRRMVYKKACVKFAFRITLLRASVVRHEGCHQHWTNKHQYDRRESQT